MGFLTSRLGLRKPNIGDAPLITDFDGNWDILDQAILAKNNGSDFLSMPSTRLNLKVPVLSAAVAVATTNVSALNTYLPVIDGVTAYPGMQVLLTAQTNAKQNGPWLVSNGPGIAWTRPLDFTTGTKLGSRLIGITAGTVGAGQIWQLSTTSQITVDTDSQIWTKASGATAFSYVSKAVDYTLTSADDVVEFTASGHVITLHNAATATKKRYAIVNSSGGNMSFATTASQTVNGSTTGTIVPNQSLEVVPNGTSWLVT